MLQNKGMLNTNFPLSGDDKALLLKLTDTLVNIPLNLLLLFVSVLVNRQCVESEYLIFNAFPVNK